MSSQAVPHFSLRGTNFIKCLYQVSVLAVGSAAYRKCYPGMAVLSYLLGFRHCPRFWWSLNGQVEGAIELKVREYLVNRTGQLIGLSVVLSLANLAPFRHWLLEINQSFGGYYLVFHLFSLVFIATAGRKMRSSKIILLPLAWLTFHYLLIVLPYYQGSAAERDSSKQSIRVVTINLWSQNQHTGLVRQLISDQAADLLGLIEYTPDWQQRLELNQDYPYRLEYPALGNFGLAIFSRFPIAEVKFTDLGGDLPRTLGVVLEVGGRKVDFILMHAMPPISAQAWSMDCLLFRRVAGQLRESANPLIVAGDLNATPFSKSFRSFVRGALLKPAFAGFGWYRSWDVDLPIFRLMLDHLFFRGNLRVVEARVLSDVGSDHFPLFVEFQLD